MSGDDSQYVLDTLDALGVALVDHGHKWTAEQRERFDKSVDLLKARLSACLGGQ